MTKLSATLCILLPFLHQIVLSQATDEVIMEERQKLFPGSGNAIIAQNNYCKLQLQTDGNLISRRNIKDEWKISWSSGAIGSGEHYAQLQPNGNLVIYTDDTETYSTNMGIPCGFCEEPTKLVYDSDCRLKILCVDEVLWENIKVPPFTAGQVLQKGEMFTQVINFGQVCSMTYSFSLYYHLALKHNCNLVQYVGTDEADRDGQVWRAFDSVPEGITDCYLYLDKGRAVLYEGIFDNSIPEFESRPGEYWSTPDDWMSDHYDNYEEISESYEVLVDSSYYGDNDSFHWRCCNQTVWPGR